MNLNNIRIVRKNHHLFPKSLQQIQGGPENLYCIGDIKLLQTRCMAVVGSRKCSEYGKQVAMKIGKSMAENEITLVSGMAKGIDYFGHLGALRNGGKTIAVLGCGIDVCYPKSHQKLYEEIEKFGLILSEYPPGTSPRQYMFPARNRIIAALSEATVVVEAGTNSGALITAELAAGFGKEVFAVPGNITSQYSLGSNKLLMDGARPIAVIDDLYYGMGMIPKHTVAETENLGDDEKMIYHIILKEGETTVDSLCKRLKKDSLFINGVLGILEIKGLVCYQSGKIFIAKF